MSKSLTQAQWTKYSKGCEDRRQKQLQAAYNKGFQAFAAGIPRDQNGCISRDWKELWWQGWDKAAREVAAAEELDDEPPYSDPTGDGWWMP